MLTICWLIFDCAAGPSWGSLPWWGRLRRGRGCSRTFQGVTWTATQKSCHQRVCGQRKILKKYIYFFIFNTFRKLCLNWCLNTLWELYICIHSFTNMWWQNSTIQAKCCLNKLEIWVKIRNGHLFLLQKQTRRRQALLSCKCGMYNSK